MRKSLVFYTLLLCMYAGFANMASPFIEGTYAGSAFSSRNMDILRERIFFTPDRYFSSARFVVEYVVKSDVEGTQIPLLFHAMSYLGEFSVSVDGQPVQLKEIPNSYTDINDSPFNGFATALQKDSARPGAGYAEVSWGQGSQVYSLHELKYFEADFSKGEHIIKVEYTATVWEDQSGQMNEYSFRYSLSPARHWRSFGALEITMDGRAAHRQLSSNLGPPAWGRTDSIAQWTFDKLPEDYFFVAYSPEPPLIARLGAEALLAIVALLVAGLNVWLIRRHWRQKEDRPNGALLILFSVAAPFIILIVTFAVQGLFSSEEAGNAGNISPYAIIFMGPFLLLLYYLAMFIANRIAKSSSAKQG